jgi:flagellin-like hook-associated protein FlgL
MKGLLEDIVRDANAEYNGHYLFSGTKTTAQSLDPGNQFANETPFEIKEGKPTADNPSGLSVIFKGNNKDRSINKTPFYSEVINVKSDDLFGKDSIEVFDAIINLHNVFSYNKAGEQRTPQDKFSRAEAAIVNQFQAIIGNKVDSINEIGAQNGAKINRLEIIRDQQQMENTQLRQIRSLEQDTDIAESTLNLKKDEAALQYSLQIGSRLIPQTLFDFLR